MIWSEAKSQIEKALEGNFDKNIFMICLFPGMNNEFEIEFKDNGKINIRNKSKSGMKK